MNVYGRYHVYVYTINESIENVSINVCTMYIYEYKQIGVQNALSQILQQLMLGTEMTNIICCKRLDIDCNVIFIKF